LTWDHVPPKAGITVSPVEIDNISKILTNQTEPRMLISQNGVRYRTICGDCNSKLGRNYDTVLTSLNKDVSLYLKSNLYFPAYTYIKTKPNKLIKAILGHLMSAKEEIDEFTFDNRIRKYLFSETESLPDDINILYWIYPYNCTIIMRDFMMFSRRGDFSSEPIVCNVLKYFPLAFLITDKPNYHNLPSLTKFKSNNIDDEINLRIDLKRVETLDWPERVDNGNIVFTTAESQKAILAKPRKI
jgi:hypothetical protein